MDESQDILTNGEDLYSWVDNIENPTTPKYNRFPPLKPRYHKGTTPIGNDLLEDFFYCISKVIDTGVDMSCKTLLQWAQIIYPTLDSLNRQKRMSRVHSEYFIYFTEEAMFTFDIDKIVEHFPYIFDFSQWNDFSGHELQSEMYPAIYEALEKELKESRTPRNVKSYQIDFIKEVETKTKKTHIYSLSIVAKEGEDPHIREGLSVAVKIGKVRYTVEVIEYDFENGNLFVTSNQPIIWRISDNKRLYIDSSFLLDKLRKCIESFQEQNFNRNLPIYKFIHHCTQLLSTVEYPISVEKYNVLLNESQQSAFHASLSNDITFIWGPPGTGKTFTLSRIIRALYEIPDERTVVCCISNVAVDLLVNNVVDILNGEHSSIPSGEFYRAGHTTDPKIIETDFLFPEDATSKALRQKIARTLKNIEYLKAQQLEDELSDQIIELKAKLKDSRKELHNHTDYLVKKSRVVFSTVANFISSAAINSCQFDNLLVDEASMLSIPNLMALASQIAKRIIIVGDFQQLSPISLVPDKWLKNNIFSYCGIDESHTSHPGLHMLLQQRRSQKAIVELINSTFYQDKLHAERKSVDDIVNIGPANGYVVARYDVEDAFVRHTRGGTRQNTQSAAKIIQLLDAYYRAGDYKFTIGIITPYVGQTQLIKALVKQQDYPIDFLDRIRIGTIHTFQGSESDVIVFDIVDCPNKSNPEKSNVGRIYGGKDGEHLINVAVSRARHKLLVVGDVKYMCSPDGDKLTDKTLGMFRQLFNVPSLTI